jgi:glucose dehydrogenase
MNRINFTLFQWMNLSFCITLLILFTFFKIDAQVATTESAMALAIHEVTDQSTGNITTNHNYWGIENALEREKLPLYVTTPAATPEELTAANGYPKRKTFLTWHRSLGDNSGARYSALDQINSRNVTNLQIAWIYHSKDGSNYTECNPIIVRNVMIVPTPGKFIVGVNAENGRELWRFKPEGNIKPEGRPAFRGLIY